MTGKPLVTNIPKQLHPEVWAKYQYGTPVEAISKWLLEQGVQVHPRTVYRLLKEYNDEKREITKAIYAQEVLAKAHSDLNTVDEMINSLYANYQERLDNNDHKYAVMYAQSLEKYLSFRRNLMMGDETLADAPKTPLIEDLMSKLINVTNNQTPNTLAETISVPAEVISDKPNSN